jgi:hypothetical protein
MRDGPSVVALVTRAAGDDQQAWDELDAGQSVWLLLVTSSHRIR